ncbi:MAG: hypothetical protein WCX71_02710 [Candidatus Buchananbacteria bacterium]
MKNFRSSDNLARQTEYPPQPDAETADNYEQYFRFDKPKRTAARPNFETPKVLKSFITPEMVGQATSLDELCHSLEKFDRVSGTEPEGEYTSDYVIGEIRNFEKYFQENVDHLLLTVITGKKDETNNELWQKLTNIPIGQGSLGLRQKVKNLMEQEWAKRFKEKQTELMTEAISQTNNLGELNKIIGQFKIIRSNKQEYQPEKVIAAIENISLTMNNLVLAASWQEADVNQIGQELDSIFKIHSLPQEFGIYQQAYKLIFHEVLAAIKKQNFESQIKKINEPGAISNFGKKIGSWFSHRK